MKKKTKKFNLKVILGLQVLVLIYSLTGTVSKLASNAMGEFGIFSWQVFGLGVLMVAVLGVYAIFWQRVLKRVDLSVAYANKGIGILWTLVWSTLIFKESITLLNVVGIIVICVGVMVVTMNE